MTVARAAAPAEFWLLDLVAGTGCRHWLNERRKHLVLAAEPGLLEPNRGGQPVGGAEQRRHQLDVWRFDHTVQRPGGDYRNFCV